MARPAIDFEKAHALVVGIAGYANIRKLPKVDDARDVAAALRDGELCGYGRVKVLEEAEATREAILAELGELAKEPIKSAVLIYFSGHGALIEDGEHPGEQYLLPFGTVFPPSATLHETAISGKDLSEMLAAIADRTEQLIVILDCCHSGDLIDLGGFAKDLDDEIQKDVMKVRPGLSDDYLNRIKCCDYQAILAAAWMTGKAIVRRGAQHGDFTQHLLDGLKGAARGHGGSIRITELFDYIAEQLEKAHVAGQIRQKPYFNARYSENFPIARHLGGKSGSGATFTGALAVLKRLIDENPDVRAMVVDIEGKMKAARRQIGAVTALKTLHKKLHEMELELFNSIVREQARFPEEDRACRNLANWAKQVKIGATRMRAVATAIYPGPRGAEEWIEGLVGAAGLLHDGAEARDRAKVDDAIWGLNDVLSTLPSQVNTDLLDGVRKMDLRELFRELLRIGDEIATLDVAEDDVRTFIAGGRDLGRLDGELDELMDQHDHWQDIDGQLRRIENNWKGHPRELDSAWPKLSRAIGSQLDSVAPSHQGDIRDAVGGVVGVSGQCGSDRQYDAFLHLRSQVVDWFRTLDDILLERIDEFDHVDGALKFTLAAIHPQSP